MALSNYDNSRFDPTKWINKRKRQAATLKKPAVDPLTTPVPAPTVTRRQMLGQSEGTGSSTLASFQDLANLYGGAAQNPNAAYLAAIGAVPTRPVVTQLPGGEGSVPTTDWTGFAGNFSEIGMPILYDNPELISNEVLKNMGFNTRSGMMDLAAERAQDLQYLAMMTLGMGGTNSNDPQDYLNFANETIRGMMDPGGKGALDSAALIQRVLDAPSGSALKSLLETGDPQQQAAILNNLIMAAAGSKTPLMQRAMQGALEDRSNSWLTQNAKGADVGFLADWLQKGGKGLFGP